jgi:hypothetical protein
MSNLIPGRNGGYNHSEINALNALYIEFRDLSRSWEDFKSKYMPLGAVDKGNGPATGSTVRVVLEDDNYNALLNIDANSRYNGLINTPGIKVFYTYYVGVALGNPSGAANISSETYQDSGGATLLTRTFSWDVNDKIVSIDNN